MLIVILVFSHFAGIASASSDIDGHALEKEMREAVERGVLNGIGNGQYAPDRSVTREEFVALLIRAIDVEPRQEGQTFTDVSNENIFRDAIRDASAAGVIGGYPDGTFRPKQNIDRQQMAAMIEPTLTQFNIEDPEGDETAFLDLEDVRPEFRDQVKRNAAFGIIKGSPTPQGILFNPKLEATRAEAAAFIIRTQDVIDEFYIPAPMPEESPAEEPPADEEKAPEEAPEEESPADEEKAPEEGPAEESPTDEEKNPGDIPEEELPLEEEKDPEEIIEEPLRYFTAKVDEDGEIKTASRGFEELGDAMDARSGDYPYVTMNDHLIWIDEGIVRPNPDAGSTITIYNHDDLTGPATYVTNNPRFSSEMDFVDSDGEVIEISYAGRSGYIRSIDALLFPGDLAKERNYYSVNRSGDLLHFYYRFDLGVYEGPVRIGKAPAFMEPGERYYSQDGKAFFDASGEAAGEAEQYFQSLPVISETAYTAEDLDRYFEEGSPAFLDSPLKGYGEAFIEAQETYGINALYLAAKAIHESAWGTSQIAQKRNNLFGIRATDSNPFENALDFESLEANILYAAKFIREGYAHHSDWRFEGSLLGNKSEGFNVRYASDMFWGQKIAGHMYRADRFLGGEDIHAYEIYRTVPERLNVRFTPDTSQAAMYTYRRSGYPVIKTGSVENRDGETWFEVVPDHKDEERAYIRSDLLEKRIFSE